MGYTHYWYRQKEIGCKVFKAIVDDFNIVLLKIYEAGVLLGNAGGDDMPIINYNEVLFNGLSKCGHPKNEDIVIPWPSKDAGGVANPWKENAQSGHWFAGAELSKRVCDGDCSYESFVFPRIMDPERYGKIERDGLFFECCKTAFRPYDLAVIVFLLIAKKHLGNGIRVSSDGTDQQWFDGKLFCQMELGYGMEFKITDDGLVKKNAKYQDQWKIRSETNLAKWYTVSLDRHGNYVCSCPHHIYRKVECKHIKKVISGIGLNSA